MKNKAGADSGIYSITNKVNGAVYIGSAVSIKRRFSEHRKHLRGKVHKNRFLQNAWDKYGEGSFEFTTLLPCPVEVLISEEQAAIDKHAASGCLYNLNPTAGSRLGAKVSDEGRKRISDSLRGKPGRHCKPHSEETKEKMRGRVYSAETRAKMAAAKLGKKRAPFTEETLRRMSEAAKARRGIPWSDARRAAYEQRIDGMNNGK